MAGQARPAFWTSIRNCLTPLAGPYRSRLLVMAGLWNSIGLIGGPMITYFSLFAKRDHHWKSHQVAAAIILAYAMGTIGSMLSGFLMDRLGRRFTTSFFYLLSAARDVCAVHQRYVRRDPRGRSRHDVCVSGGAHRDPGALHRIVSDRHSGDRLQSLRAGDRADLWDAVAGRDRFALEVAGRFGQRGVDLRLGSLFGVVLVWWFVPETRGKTLEELSPSVAEAPPVTTE